MQVLQRFLQFPPSLVAGRNRLYTWGTTADESGQLMCILCKIASGEIPASFRYESPKVVAFNDLDPKAPTHILIIPKAHHENIAELAASDGAAAAELFTAASTLASELGLDGYRIAINTGASAGQSVFHTHIHLLAGRAFAWPPG